MKNNKFFSPSLMWEGIKQTKMVGICFVILSILASCGYPFLRLISYNSMNSEGLKAQPNITIDLGTFLLPIFLIQFIMPMVLIFMMFSFLNKREASDFYHSIPLNRTCVYITYTVVPLLWSLVTILASTFLSYTIYACTQKTIINSEFIWTTIISSFILAMLVSSIALIAKGLSGTIFSNIIIFIIVMLLPRIIILLYTIAVNMSIKIADISFMSFSDIYNNIVFAPFYSTNKYNNLNMPNLSARTFWYSSILAVIYFIVAFVIHKFRNSESAGKSASYKVVQPVVRILLGAIPLLLISVTFASGSEVVPEFWLIGIVVSLLLYFLYELITTKSAKKLVAAIPFYLIAILANAVFVSVCIGQRNFILNDIPEVSEISSVSVVSDYYTKDSSYSENNYYRYKTQNVNIDDKEFIKILQSSLVESVQKVKDHKNLNGKNTESCKVVYHCTSGRDIERIVYVDDAKYGNGNDSVVVSYLMKNEDYLNAVTSLPTDEEIKSISLFGKDFTDEECRELWEVYKDEYNAASIETKDKLNYRMDSAYNTGRLLTNFQISGYVGTNSFFVEYSINSELTPKTYNKYINMYMSKLVKNGIVDKILDSSRNGDIFNLEFNDISSNSYNVFSLQYCKENIEAEDLFMESFVYGSLERYNVTYGSNDIDEKAMSELRKIPEIIANAISDNVDPSKGNMIECYATIDSDLEYYYDEDGNVNGYSNGGTSEVIYVNISDEQYDEINNILKKCCKSTPFEDSKN